MPYLDTLTPALPYSDSDTSREAAVAMVPHAQTQRDALEVWFRCRGSVGSTDAEAESIPMRRSSICARRNELWKLGRVEKTNARRGGCAVWRHVEAR